MSRKPSNSKVLAKAHKIACEQWNENKHLREQYPKEFSDEVNYNLYRPSLSSDGSACIDGIERIIPSIFEDRGGVHAHIYYPEIKKSYCITFAPSVSYYKDLF